MALAKKPKSAQIATVLTSKRNGYSEEGGDTTVLLS
jgi:hypothetical protein